MKKCLCSIVAIVIVAGCGQSDPIVSDNNGKVSSAYDPVRHEIASKEKILEMLVDPKSAEFKDVFFHESAEGIPATCGKVNSKNKMGGYTGYQGFISFIDINVLQSSFTDDNEFLKAWDRYCVN